jgi:DNA-binding MarR family transcriptional regulator
LNFSALSVLRTLLERDGLIERRPDPCDERASMLSLTADGQSIVSRRHADRGERLRNLIDRLSPADRTRPLSIAGFVGGEAVSRYGHGPRHPQA